MGLLRGLNDLKKYLKCKEQYVAYNKCCLRVFITLHAPILIMAIVLKHTALEIQMLHHFRDTFGGKESLERQGTPRVPGL